MAKKPSCRQEMHESPDKGSSVAEITPAQEMKAVLLTVMMDFQQEIRMRAYEIFCERDSASATALDDWLKAEQEIKARNKAGITKTTLES